MELPQQRFKRLVSALDELVTQETVVLANGDYVAVQAVQRRADPVVSALAQLGPEEADANARARIANLLARRQHNIEFLETQLATARAELLAVQESTQRVARIAPVYGRPQTRVGYPQFSATG